MSIAAGQKVRTTDINNLPYVTTMSGQFRATSTSGISTETVVLTLPAVNLLANTTYRIKFTALWTASASGAAAELRIRQTSIAGAVLQAAITPASETGGGPYEETCSNILQTNSSPPVGYVIVGTIVLALGSGTVGVAVGTELVVEQIGPNGSFTSV